MDELRYYIMTRPRPPEKSGAVSEVIRDKKKRINKLKRKPVCD